MQRGVGLWILPDMIKRLVFQPFAPLPPIHFEDLEKAVINISKKK